MSKHQILCKGVKSKMNESGRQNFKGVISVCAYFKSILIHNQLQILEFVHKYLHFEWMQNLLSNVTKITSQGSAVLEKSQVRVIKTLFMQPLIFID